MSIARQSSDTATWGTPSDGRREERYPAQPGVRLILQVSPDSEPEEAQLRDISLHGFGISTARYIEPGSQVLLRTRKQRIQAEVIYCNVDGDRYRTGIIVHHAAREQTAYKRTRDWETLLTSGRGQ